MENRAPEVAIEAEGKPMPPVINIMDALKKSMQKQGANQGARYPAKTHGQSGCSQSASESFTGAEGGIEENYIKFDLALGASDSFPLG